jgi:exonuclease I
MALAIMYPEAKRGSKSEKLSDFSDNLGVSKGHAKDLISDARAVLAYSRELADAVRDGTIKLDAAVAELGHK